jgi:hypothetical protein
MAGAVWDQAVRAETACTTEGGRRRKAHCGEQLEHVSLHRVDSLFWLAHDYIIIST